MERIRDLNRYQKGILILLVVSLVVFTAVYIVVSNRVGFEYQNTILIPSEEDGATLYSGTIWGEQAVFTVQGDTVTFRYGDRVYGPYTVREDAAAIPEEHADIASVLTGVEVRLGEAILFRGGVYHSPDIGMVLFGEDGKSNMVDVVVVMSDGTRIDSNGNVVDEMEPSVTTIVTLAEGPELTHRGEWMPWVYGVVFTLMCAVSILFADELFRWNLSFQIRNVDRAEPTDWEIAGRYISWTVLAVGAQIMYIMGLTL